MNYELLEAQRASTSQLHKCEKVLDKLESGKSQHTLTKNCIKALRISSRPIARALEEES